MYLKNKWQPHFWAALKDTETLQPYLNISLSSSSPGPCSESCRWLHRSVSRQQHHPCPAVSSVSTSWRTFGDMVSSHIAMGASCFSQVKNLFRGLLQKSAFLFFFSKTVETILELGMFTVSSAVFGVAVHLVRSLLGLYLHYLCVFNNWCVRASWECLAQLPFKWEL